MAKANKNVTERERKYNEEVLSKLSAGIKQMGLEMKTNIILANSGIYTVKDLRRILEAGEHINNLEKKQEEYICRCLQIPMPQN